MILFNSDYTEGAAPEILARLAATNLDQHSGYSTDEYSTQARELIKAACKNDQLAVHLVVGGTQANLMVISAALRPHQGVLTAESGHISVHETGAIEASGHKVLALPSPDGKITAQQVAQYCDWHFHNEAFEHIVQPKMVYISLPTEIGTMYSRAELSALRQVCDKYELYLYLDGARLGYGLAAQGNDIDLPFLAQVCDVFYIGGTKQGMLFGEGIVIKHADLQKDFRYIIKQKGGLLAKGWLLGLQFITMFENGLYFKLARHAIDMAMKLKTGFTAAGYEFLKDSPTNQQFPILSDAKLAVLAKKYGFSYEKRIDEHHSAVRFCTSWATKEEHVQALLADIKNS